MLDSHRSLWSGRVPARSTSVDTFLEQRRVIEPKVKKTNFCFQSTYLLFELLCGHSQSIFLDTVQGEQAAMR